MSDAGGVVWIVDDSPTEAALVRSYLDGYDVDVMLDGATALGRLAVRPPPDVLVLDWQMPELSGLEVCRFLRRTFASTELPVLVLTALSGPDDAAECFAAGANDYVRKPCSRSELRARVAKELRLLRATREAAMYQEEARIAQALGGERESELRQRIELEQHLIGIVSHDLRNPLTTIRLGVDLVKQASVPPRAEKVLQRMAQATTRATTMVRDLLDYSSTRFGGALEIEPRAMNLHVWIDGACEEAMQTHAGRAVVVVKQGDGAGEWDEARLQQVVGNLIGNAVAYGSVDRPITVRVGEHGADVVLSVHNHGEPIAEGAQAALFEPLVRSGEDRRTGERSIGLGLYIVRHIVHAHGGTVRVSSSAEEGTTFTAVLPRSRAAAAKR